MIAYREIRPCAALAEHVECYWVMSGGQGEGPAAPVERILPDGCVELVLHLADAFRQWRTEGTSRPQPRIFFVGPTTGFLLIQPGGCVDTLGVRFRPGSARALLGVPLGELAHRLLPLEALLGAPAARWLEAVGNARGAARLRLLEAFLLRRLKPDAEGARRARAAVRAALARRGQLPVAALARLVDVTPRQLERTFLSEVGMAPKSFLRLARFQGIFESLAVHGAPDWADLALASGYADQAHLIRDFREFSGETPLSLLRSQGALSRHFTSPERLRAFFASG